MFEFSSEKIDLRSLDADFDYNTIESSDTRFEWREGTFVDWFSSWDYSYTSKDYRHGEVCDIVTYDVQGAPVFHEWLNKAKKIIEDVYGEHRSYGYFTNKDETRKVSICIPGVPEYLPRHSEIPSVSIYFNARHPKIEEKILKRIGEIA